MAGLSLSARTETLEGDIRAITDTVRATVGVAAVFDDGDTLAVDDGHSYPMMSVYKFHQALAVLDSLDRSGQPLTTAIRVRKADMLLHTWSPLRKELPEGDSELPVTMLLEYSVAQSDNNVCDVLFRWLGGTQRVNRYIAELGIGETMIEATEAEMHCDRERQYRNWTTPLAAVRLLEKFRRGEILSLRSRTFLENTMLATVTGPDKLRALLPFDVRVAHKTGSAFRNANGIMVADNDIGIVRLPDGRSYSIAVFVMDSAEDDRTNAAVIARISKAVYDYYTAK